MDLHFIKMFLAEHVDLETSPCQQFPAVVADDADDAESLRTMLSRSLDDNWDMPPNTAAMWDVYAVSGRPPFFICEEDYLFEELNDSDNDGNDNNSNSPLYDDIRAHIVHSADAYGGHNVYSVGFNRYGQQGDGSRSHVRRLQLMHRLPVNSQVADIAFDRDGSPWILFRNGELYSCGKHAYTTGELVPTLIRPPYKILCMSSGITALHRFVVSVHHDVYAVGRNTYCQCGIDCDASPDLVDSEANGSESSDSSFAGRVHDNKYPLQAVRDMVSTLTLVSQFTTHSTRIQQIGVGLNYSVFVSAAGNVYLHGWNCCSAENDEWMCEMETVPPNQLYRIDALKDITTVQCMEDEFRALDIDGVVFTCDEEGVRKLLLPAIQKIACGEFHALYLDTDGTVWSDQQKYMNKEKAYAGSYQEHSNMMAQSVWVVKGLPVKSVADIKCGDWHHMAKTTDNEYFLWGANDYQQCLVYDRNQTEVALPTSYVPLSAFEIVDMFLGWKQTIVITQMVMVRSTPNCIVFAELEKFLKTRLSDCGYRSMTVAAKGGTLEIVVRCLRPRLMVGPLASRIKQLTQDLKVKFNETREVRLFAEKGLRHDIGTY
mmetsp:Transcript_51878/g.85892  ORF Transcript_51878/g.85892 Transcript_51878/m.85892 type:complete len:600 (-) Transcript_51878:46-1845(-)